MFTGIVENGFGILANRWRVLHTPLGVTPDRARQIVLACITLHNLLRKRYPQLVRGEVDEFDDEGNVVVRGQWREGLILTPGHNLVGNRIQREAKMQRNYLCDYYNSPIGALPWQDRVVSAPQEEF